MVNAIVLEVGLLAQIVIQFYNAYLAFKTSRIINGGNHYWVLSLGFFLMGVRRVTSLFTVERGLSLVEVADKLFLPLLISVVIFYGLHRLYKASIKKNEEIDDVNGRMKSLEKSFKQLTKKKNE